jgi:hypothetical protein
LIVIQLRRRSIEFGEVLRSHTSRHSNNRKRGRGAFEGTSDGSELWVIAGGTSNEGDCAEPECH